MHQTPILWSFRRCPYAMRARLTILYAGIKTDLRDILLKDKPAQMTTVSPKATVPVLDTGTKVIDESRDIMLWALRQNDPENWLSQLGHHDNLLGHAPTMADTAIQPFVRQFANTDRDWFNAQDWPHLIRWLTAFEGSASFKAIMVKRPIWAPGAAPLYFP